MKSETRRLGLASRELSTTRVGNVAGNDFRADGHIVPLSVNLCQQEEGKDMDQQPVVENQFFRGRTYTTCPLPMLGAWLDKLLKEEMKQLSTKMQVQSGKGNLPQYSLC